MYNLTSAQFFKLKIELLTMMQSRKIKAQLLLLPKLKSVDTLDERRESLQDTIASLEKARVDVDAVLDVLATAKFGQKGKVADQLQTHGIDFARELEQQRKQLPDVK